MLDSSSKDEHGEINSCNCAIVFKIVPEYHLNMQPLQLLNVWCAEVSLLTLSLPPMRWHASMRRWKVNAAIIITVQFTDVMDTHYILVLSKDVIVEDLVTNPQQKQRTSHVVRFYIRSYWYVV